MTLNYKLMTIKNKADEFISKDSLKYWLSSCGVFYKKNATKKELEILLSNLTKKHSYGCQIEQTNPFKWR